MLNSEVFSWKITATESTCLLSFFYFNSYLAIKKKKKVYKSVMPCLLDWLHGFDYHFLFPIFLFVHEKSILRSRSIMPLAKIVLSNLTKDTPLGDAFGFILWLYQRTVQFLLYVLCTIFEINRHSYVETACFFLLVWYILFENIIVLLSTIWLFHYIWVLLLLLLWGF